MKIVEWYIYSTINNEQIGETYECESMCEDEVMDKLISDYGYPREIYIKKNDSWEE